MDARKERVLILIDGSDFTINLDRMFDKIVD